MLNLGKGKKKVFRSEGIGDIPSFILDWFVRDHVNFISKNSCDIIRDTPHTFCLSVRNSDSRYFIKGYRSSTPLKSLSYLFRPSRCEHVWSMSGRFLDHGIPTPVPLYGVCTGNPWNPIHGALIYPWLEGVEESKELARQMLSSFADRTFLLEKAALFLCNMHERGIAHTDTKITNFILQPEKEPFLTIFDLDGAVSKKRIPDTLRIRDIVCFCVSLEKLDSSQDIMSQFMRFYLDLHVDWKKKGAFIIEKTKKAAEKKRRKHAAKLVNS